jgi:hypothetical protein
VVDHALKTLAPGHVVATPGALRAFRESGERPSVYLERHVRGDWGTVGDDDRLANEDALKSGARILSAYALRSGERIWIVTEAVGDDGHRASTCILLPSEY